MWKSLEEDSIAKMDFLGSPRFLSPPPSYFQNVDKPKNGSWLFNTEAQRHRGLGKNDNLSESRTNYSFSPEK